jgi:hypothetical protein
MAKCRERKGIKRPPRRPQASDHDYELAELAAVLSEYTLDHNADGWFKPAWNDGWNAVELAARVAARNDSDMRWLLAVCDKREALPKHYEEANDRLCTLSCKRLTRAALRCLQVLIANSHGGGEVYNAILVGPFSDEAREDVAKDVLEYRCRDSIGTTAQLQGDGADRQRRAFSIAWKRGLFKAAYAIKPAVMTFRTKLTILKEP